LQARELSEVPPLSFNKARLRCTSNVWSGGFSKDEANI